VSEQFINTKHRAASLRHLSFLITLDASNYVNDLCCSWPSSCCTSQWRVQSDLGQHPETGSASEPRSAVVEQNAVLGQRIRGQTSRWSTAWSTVSSTASQSDSTVGTHCTRFTV